MRKKYSFGIMVQTDWKKGSSYTGMAGASTVSPSMPILEGENLEVSPPRRLVQSFRALWSDAVKSEGTSRVTWEIEPVGDSCKLTVTHDQLREGANNELYGGWPQILSVLKTLLETGQLLTTPGVPAVREGAGVGRLRIGKPFWRAAAGVAAAAALPCTGRIRRTPWPGARMARVEFPPWRERN
jgi:hypothetical protein